MSKLLFLVLQLLHVRNIYTLISSEQCLTDVSVTEISMEMANITWNYNCKHHRIRGYKIYYDHLKYKACTEEINNNKKHKRSYESNIGPDETFRIIGSGTKLEPFSEYEFKVRPLFTDGTNSKEQEVSVFGTTENYLPVVKIRVKGVQTTPTSIIFLLDDLDPNECDKFNGDLGFIRYFVSGQSAWNTKFEQHGKADIGSTSVLVDNLQPNSEYGLQLFVTDKSMHYLDVESEDMKPWTGKTKPVAPTSLASITELTLDGSQCSIIWSDPYPPQGEVDSYHFSYKSDKSDSWQVTDNVKDMEVERVGNKKMYKIYIKGEQVEGLSVKMMLINKGFPDPSPWSEVVTWGDAAAPLDTTVIIIIAALLLILLIVMAICIARKCNMVKRFRGFEQTKSNDYAERPIFQPATSRESNNSFDRQSPRHNSNVSTIEMRTPRDRNKVNRASTGRASGMDPLPPVPGEPLYEPLRYPEEQPLDDDNYLVPNPVKVASVESLDEEGYLKPNFNRYQPFDTRSPTRESPDPIPMVSYSSQDELEKS